MGLVGTEACGARHWPSCGLQSWEVLGKCPHHTEVRWGIPEDEAQAAGWPQGCQRARHLSPREPL